MKRMFLPLLASISIYATDETSIVSNFHAINSGIVGGHVNVITGDFIDNEVDMSVTGPEPLILSRSYVSSKAVQRSFCNEGWIWNYQHYLFSYKVDKENWISFCGGAGGTVLSKDMKAKEGSSYVHKMNHFIGFTDAGLSGKTNAKNTKIYFPEHKKLNSSASEDVYVVEGNGDKYTFQGYGKGFNLSKISYIYPKDLTRCSGIKVKYNFLLGSKSNDIRYRFPFEKMEQILPNGSTASFISINNFWEEDSGFFKAPRIEIKGSDGQETFYSFHYHSKYSSYYFLTQVKSSRKPEIRYGYSLPNGDHSDKITAKRVGDLNLSIEYYDSQDGAKEGRVKALRVNHNDKILYQFDYKNNDTFVTDGNGNKKAYIANDKSRLVEIKHFAYGVPYVREEFSYGPRNTHFEGNLVRNEVKGKEGQSIYALFYEYDQQNNVNLEKLVGDFVGAGQPQTIFIHHENYCDFANNPKLTWEDNGRSTLKTYLPQSSLVKATYYREKGVIKKREFRSYDSGTTVLTQVIEDDGSSMDENDLSGVTERKIVTFTLRNEIPIGLPERIDCHVYDLATKEKRLVSRIERKYLKTGEVIEERSYGANEELKHVQFWDYDAHGNVTLHIDPLGHEYVKRYDAVDRLIYSQGPRKDIHFEYEYDLENRLIAEREVLASGEVFTKRYQYDAMGNKIADIDAFGNTTNYVYDELDRVIKTIYPETEEGVRPVVMYEYNELGFPIKTIDCMGKETRTLFTVRGKPYRIEYPDGSIETFQYSLEGNLVRKTGVDGRSFLYAYDLQNRVVQEEEVAPSGKSLGAIKHEYNTFHRLKTIDRDGMVTTYEYDAAGQLVKECCGERYKVYTYDAFGRLIQSDDGMVIKKFKYDIRDKVIEEIEENASNKIQSLVRYVYDESGHKTRVYNYINTESVIITEYNAQGLPVRVIDQEGLESIISYNFKALDELNHRVLETTAIDPNGDRLVTTLNTRGKVAKTCRYNPMGLLVSKQENIYNLKGNLVKTLHYSIVAGEVKKTISHTMEYDAMGRLMAATQAEGTPEQKRERHIYNSAGQKIETVKNDGISILMAYNEAGLLDTHKATDGSFEYAYTYNVNKQPIAIKDLKRNQVQRHSYNDYKELTQEVLQNGLTLNYQIDKFGRIEKIVLPDASTVDYTFDGKRIKTIKRNQFVHTYEQYNFGGTPTYSKLANGLESFSYLDQKGRYLSIKSPHFEENEFTYDRCGNLVQHNLDGELKNYQYNDLNQLIKDPSNDYGYDSLHNRLSKNDQIYSHNSLNQLLSHGDTTYTYDRNGNRIEKRTPGFLTTYKYDALDRMIEVNANGKITTYTYDAFNRRMSKNDTLYLYQGQNEMGSIKNGSFIDLRVLGNGHGAEIGAAVLCEIGGSSYIPIHDHSGNVMKLLTMQNEIAASYSYSSFGEALTFDTHPNQWRFASKRFDEETGFINFGRRYYDPEIGRWLTPDPIGFEDGPNLYAYLHNSPLLSFDLYGLLDNDRSLWDRTCDAFSSAWNSLCNAARDTWDYISDGCSRAGRALRDGISAGGRAMREGFRQAGRAGQWVAHNSIPHIPILKDAFKAPFYFIENGSFRGYTPTYREEHSQWYVCGDKPNPNANVEVPGISTQPPEFHERMQDECLALGGVEVYGCYVATHGFVADICNCILDFLGITTHASQVLAEGLLGLSQQVSATGKVICNAFSRGCMVLQNGIDRAISKGANAAVFYANFLAPPKLPSNAKYDYNATLSSRDGVTLYSRICNFFCPDARVKLEKGEGIYMIDHKFANQVYSKGYHENFIQYSLDLLKMR